MAKVYFYEFSGYNGNFESLCSLLPSENKEKAANIKDELKKKQFVFSRFLLRYALSKNGYTDDEITFGKNGKPYFKGGYPFFSISHSDSAVCVSLSENELGIDVQIRKELSENLTERYFSSDEREYIKKGLTTACDIWSIKESIIKYDGSSIAYLKNANVLFSGQKIYVKDRPQLKISNFSDDKYTVYLCSEDNKNNFYNIKNMP